MERHFASGMDPVSGSMRDALPSLRGRDFAPDEAGWIDSEVAGIAIRAGIEATPPDWPGGSWSGPSKRAALDALAEIDGMIAGGMDPLAALDSWEADHPSTDGPSDEPPTWTPGGPA